MYQKTRITKTRSMKVLVLINLSIGLAEGKYTEADEIRFVMETSMNALPDINGCLLVPDIDDVEEFNRFDWTRDDGCSTYLPISAIHSKMTLPGQFMPVIVVDHIIDTWNVWMRFGGILSLIAIPGTLRAGCCHPELFGLIDSSFKHRLVPMEMKEGEPFFDAIAATIYDDNI